MSDQGGTINEEDDSAMYQERLVEIFQSCDSGQKGFLSLLEFERLCRELQLQTHKQKLYQGLGLSRTSYNAKVHFEDFQSVLLALLQEVGPETLAADSPTDCAPPGTEGNTANTPDQGNWKQTGLSQNGTSDNSDLRLHLPPDMLQDDDDEFDSLRDGQDSEGRSSPASPLKRAYIEAYRLYMSMMGVFSYACDR